MATTKEPQLTYEVIGGVTGDPVNAAINDGVQRGTSIVTNRAVRPEPDVTTNDPGGGREKDYVIVTRRAAL